MRLSPEQLAATLKVDVEIARALLEQRRPTTPKATRVALVALLLGSTVFAGVGSQFFAFVSRVNPPGAGEVVPRQIPYRGFLERDGTPVASPQAFSFRLEYGDGGVAWTETTTVPVNNGHFEVALGDNPANAIPAQAFKDPFVLLSVSVGGTALVGKQRLLTVPYAASATRASEAEGALLAETTRFSTNIDTINSALSWASESEVVVHGTAGGVSSFGTVDTAVVQFTALDRQVGTAISRSSSSANGDVFTITQDGIYSIQVALIGAATGKQSIGVSLNATPAERQSDIVQNPTSRKLLAQFVDFPNGNRAYPMVSGVFRLHQNDVLRVQARNGEIAEGPSGDGAWLRITKLLPTQ